ncbi:MAG: flippase [Bacteroidota bacterium]|mgnify:FL=1
MHCKCRNNEDSSGNENSVTHLQKFLTNISSLTLADIISRIIGFFATAYLARILGVEKFGEINLGFTALSYGMLVINPGILLYATREISKPNCATSFVSDILSLRLFLSCATVAVFSFFVLYIFQANVALLLSMLFLFSLIPSSLLLEWYFQAREKIILVSISRIIAQVFYLALILFFYQVFQSLWWIPVAWLFSGIISTIFLWFFLRKEHTSFSLQLNFLSLFYRDGKWNTLLRESFPIGLGTWLAQIVTNFQLLALGILLTSADVGNYSAAFKIVFVALIVDRIFMYVFYPLIIKTYNESSEKLQTTLSFSIKIIITLLLPLCAGVCVLAPSLIHFIFGDGYEGAVPLLRVAIWFVLFSTMHSIFSFGLIGTGKEKIFSHTMLFTVAMQMLLCVLGILFFGAIGAPAGVVVGEIIAVGIIALQFKKFVHIPFVQHFFRPLVATTVMVLVLYFTPSIPFMVNIVCGAILFAVVLWIMGGISKEDFLKFQELV